MGKKEIVDEDEEVNRRKEIVGEEVNEKEK